MKTLFIHAKSNLDILPVISRIKYNGRLGLVSTIQHVEQLRRAKAFIKKSVIGGQVIGCDISKAKKIAHRVDAFLYIGSGTFHPIQIAVETGKEVLTADPCTGLTGKIFPTEVEERKQRIKAAYISFLNAERIGILVSTKKGQEKMNEADALREILKKAGRKPFIFVFDTMDFLQLANFTDIDCWINTACPRMAIEDCKKFPRPVINISELQQWVDEKKHQLK